MSNKRLDKMAAMPNRTKHSPLSVLVFFTHPELHPVRDGGVKLKYNPH